MDSQQWWPIQPPLLKNLAPLAQAVLKRSLMTSQGPAAPPGAWIDAKPHHVPPRHGLVDFVCGCLIEEFLPRELVQ